MGLFEQPPFLLALEDIGKLAPILLYLELFNRPSINKDVLP
jgi:hypothetical protein